MTVAETLSEKPVTDLDLSRFVVASHDDTIETTIEKMAEAGFSCALVTDSGLLSGVFTQKDVLLKVVGEPSARTSPTADLMTSDPQTVGSGASVADALAIMNELRVRSVPVADDGRIVGNVSFYALMPVIAGLLADHSLGTPTEVSAHHGVEYIDFTGLNTRAPITVGPDDSLELAVHQMKTQAIGSVFVVDERDHLRGVITEFDLLVRGAWGVPDLAARAVHEFMTPDPIALPARSLIVEGIKQMATNSISHVPLLGESGRPSGVASFRDMASYFETTVDLLE